MLEAADASAEEEELPGMEVLFDKTSGATALDRTQ